MNTRLPIDQSSDIDFWDKKHKKAVREPIMWIFTADELFKSFKLLALQSEDDIKKMHEQDNFVPIVTNVALMLGALAIENLIKAVRIKKMHDVFDENGKFKLGTHDLLGLAKDAEITLSEEERVILERLKEFTVWGGRYPVPKKSEAILPRKLPNGSSVTLTSSSVPSDFQKVEGFYRRLRQNLTPKIEL